MNIQFQPILVSENLSSATSFSKISEVIKQITMFETSCKWPPLVNNRHNFYS